jgi:glycosyltransferase involved in cell wall biosynthesis
MEGLGRTCVEAMLMKKPVIGTNSGGIPELIEDGNTGLLYSPGDYLKLADQIEKLLDDPAFRERLAVQGQRFALETFSKQKYGGRFNQIIRNLKGMSEVDLEDLASAIIDLTSRSFLEFIRTWNRLPLEDQAQNE